jgi:hypothetical protein
MVAVARTGHVRKLSMFALGISRVIKIPGTDMNDGNEKNLFGEPGHELARK